jgi:non-specific serine/threonine protein kinase
LRHRHFTWLAELTTAFATYWTGPEQVSWVRRLRREHANLRAAAEFGLSQPAQANTTLRILWQTREYFAIRGLETELRMWLDRALAIAPDDAPDRVMALTADAMLAGVQKDIGAAAGRLAEARDLAERGVDELLAAWVAWGTAYVALVRTDTPTVIRESAAASAVFAARGMQGPHLAALGVNGVATGLSGDVPAGRATLATVVRLSRQLGEYYQRSAALMLLARLELVSGDLAAAERAGRDGADASARLDNAFMGALCTETLAWIAALDGRPERAALLFGATDAWYGAGGVAPRRSPLEADLHARSLARARAALGDTAFDRGYRQGYELPRADVLHYAQHNEFPGEPQRDAGGLTRRETEIAHLVAQGLTSRDIAAKLVISPRTVETHVDHILGKLGFTNRAQIAAWLADAHGAPRSTTG